MQEEDEESMEEYASSRVKNVSREEEQLKEEEHTEEEEQLKEEDEQLKEEDTSKNILTKSQNMRLAATHAIMLDQTDSETEEQEKNRFWKFIDESVAIDEKTKEEVREIRTPSPVKDTTSRRSEHNKPLSSYRGTKASSRPSPKKNEDELSPREHVLRLTKQLQEQESLIMGYQKENERLVSELKDSKKLAKVLREQLSSRSSNMLSSSSRDEAYDKKIVAQNLRKQLDLESQIESMRQKLVYEKRENVCVLHT